MTHTATLNKAATKFMKLFLRIWTQSDFHWVRNQFSHGVLAEWQPESVHFFFILNSINIVLSLKT